MTNYFETPEKIPANVQDILKTFDDNLDLYHECRRIESELKKINWLVDWGLDGELYNLRPYKEVCKLDNGQYYVRIGNIELTQTNINGMKINDCAEYITDESTPDSSCFISLSVHDEKMTPLFKALHNFKCGFPI
jgi:hypothetical protein